jgi:cytochrome c peroxidase
MKKYLIVLLLIFASIVTVQFLSCSRNQPSSVNDLTYNPTPYSLNVPPGFPPPILSDSNPLTVEGIALGRKLYYDPILSTNGLSCSSCHPQSKAFTNGCISRAGFNGGDSVSIKAHINLAWNPNFLWDGSEPNPESVCLLDFGPMFFNSNMSQLAQNLKSSPTYPAMFYHAFGISDVTTLTSSQLQLKIVEAVSQFIRTLISANSKFDKFVKNQVDLTPSEMRGYIDFMTEKADCFHCHGTILFTDNVFKNNGLKCDLVGADQGRYLVTGRESDMGKFLAPTLRNIALTAPYMHDGSIKTLADVIEFYNSGVCKTSPNIDPLMTLPAKEFGLQLTDSDKADLINFLNTLTDSSFITNPNFSNPN